MSLDYIKEVGTYLSIEKVRPSGAYACPELEDISTESTGTKSPITPAGLLISLCVEVVDLTPRVFGEWSRGVLELDERKDDCTLWVVARVVRFK